MELPITMPAADSELQAPLDFAHRKAAILQRWLLIILAAYLTVFRYLAAANFKFVALFAAAFAATNILLMFVPSGNYMLARIQRTLTATDVVFVSATLFLLRTQGTYLYAGFILIVVLA